MSNSSTFCLLTFLLSSFIAHGEGIKIKDVTNQWTYGHRALSAFNGIVDSLPTGEDHEELFAIFHYKVIENGKERTRRIEGFSSSGDCGTSYYLISDAEQIKYNKDGEILGYYSPGNPYRYNNDGPRAYYIDKYSSWYTLECGDRDYDGRFVYTDQKVPYFKLKDFQNFIEKKFINKDGRIQKIFVPICDGDYKTQGERACITADSLGDLGA